MINYMLSGGPHRSLLPVAGAAPDAVEAHEVVEHRVPQSGVVEVGGVARARDHVHPATSATSEELACSPARRRGDVGGLNYYCMTGNAVCEV